MGLIQDDACELLVRMSKRVASPLVFKTRSDCFGSKEDTQAEGGRSLSFKQKIMVAFSGFHQNHFLGGRGQKLMEADRQRPYACECVSNQSRCQMVLADSDVQDFATAEISPPCREMTAPAARVAA